MIRVGCLTLMDSLSGSENGTTEGIRRAALEIAARRKAELLKIKQTLVNGEEQEALGLMKQFLGITGEQHEKGNRTNPSIN